MAVGAAVLSSTQSSLPKFSKVLVLRNSRYNQQLGKAACIIEVGATGNTLEESMGAMKYLAKILHEM